MLAYDHDVCADARYLGSSIVVSPFALGKHTSVEERYPGTASKF